MIVKKLDIHGDCSHWDQYVFEHDASNVFQLSAWGRAVHNSMGHELFYLYVEDNGVIKAILPLIHVKSMLFGNSLISTGFSIGGGPLFDNDDALKMLDEEAIKIASDLGADNIEYRQMNKCHSDWPIKDTTYSTFRKELSADHDENMLAIPRKQRAMVRKGIKFELKYEIDEDIDRLYHLYALSVRNLGTPVFPKSLFKELKKQYGDKCEVLTVISPEGEAISSVMSFYFKNEVVPYFGGGGFSARKYAANDFMYWSLMEHSVETHNSTLFDFGRSKNGTGAFNFKKNWGFTPTPLEYEYYLKDGGEIPEVNPLNPKYQLMIKTWQKLPLPIAKLIGPMVAKSLG